MFEAEETRVPESHGAAEDRLRVTEIFYSLQGEASFRGLPCVFVRTTACNLRCTWCDTAYAFKGGTTLTLDQILERVQSYPSRRVELTGGEPLLQRGVPKLAERLLALGYEVWCETSGERDIDLLPPGVRRVMDLKAPGSGEAERNRWDNLEKLRPGDELKIVCADRADFDWAVARVQEHRLLEKAPVMVSPVFGRLEAKTLAAWILESGLDLRLSTQLHKELWGDVPGV